MGAHELGGVPSESRASAVLSAPTIAQSATRNIILDMATALAYFPQVVGGVFREFQGGSMARLAIRCRRHIQQVEDETLDLGELVPESLDHTVPVEEAVTAQRLE